MSKIEYEMSPIMRAAERAAERVASWSKAKQEYAARVLSNRAGSLRELDIEDE